MNCNYEGKQTCEHALKLVRVFEAAGFLKLRDHTRLTLIRRRHAVDQALRELRGVERLEDILVLDVLEQNHLRDPSVSMFVNGDATITYYLIESFLQVTLFTEFVALPEECIGVFS